MNALSKRFIDIISLIICSPYFAGKKHGATGEINFSDKDLTSGDQYSMYCKRSMMGDSQTFYWTLSSVNGKLKQDEKAVDKKVVENIQDTFFAVDASDEHLIEQNPDEAPSSLVLRPITYD